MCDVRAGQAAVRLIESEAGIGNSRLILSPIGDAGNAAANQIRAMIPCQGSVKARQEERHVGDGVYEVGRVFGSHPAGWYGRRRHP